jgi:protein-tyrosine phosphatase
MTQITKRLHVCFVCSGNTCRSPMAALVFRTRLERAGLADVVKVSSAGIGAWHAGEPADPRARATLRAHGYPAEHLAAEIDEEKLGADLLLAAAGEHVEFLRERVGPERVRLLRDFDPTAPEGAELEDPYSGDAEGYERTFRMIERAMPELVRWAGERSLVRPVPGPYAKLDE